MRRLSRPFPALLAAATLLAALGSAAGSVLTLDEALRQAVDRHPDLAAQRRQLGVAETERIRAGWWLPDNPNIQGFYGPGGDSDLGVSISQQVEVAGQIVARHTIAEAGIRQTAAEIAAFRQEALADVKAAFFDVLYWQERLSLADAAISVAADLDRIARARLAAQDIAEVDATQAALALDAARARRADVSSQLQVSHVGLARLIGQTPDEPPAVAGALSPAGTPPAESDALAQALARRPDLQALQAQLQQSQGQLDLAIREIVPDPTLSLSYGRRATTKGNPGANLANEAGDTVQFGLSLPIPVVNYRQDQRARLQAEMAVIQARQTALQTRIARQVGEALAGWRLRLPAARTYQTMMPALQRTLDLLRAAYREGQVDLQRVLLAQDQLIQTRTALLDVQRSLRQSEIAVDRALGRLDVAGKEKP